MTFSISYLFELRNLAVNRRLLAKGTILRMKRSSVLLGSRRVKRSGTKSSTEGDEDDWDFQDDLLQPNKVAIADDTNAYQLFGDRVFCAPQEDILEGIPFESIYLLGQLPIYHQNYTFSWVLPV
jgi:hypothetical protein